MPNRKDKSKPTRSRKVGNEATPELISILSHDFEIETSVELAGRMGNEPFASMTKEEGVHEARRLWKLHAVAATAFCIGRCGAGTRPDLFWDDKERPYVRERDWYDPADASRFAKERAAADLEFLRTHTFLTEAEKLQLAEAEREKTYGTGVDF